MINKFALGALACLLAGTASAAGPAKAKSGGMTEDQKTLYFLGQAVSSRLKQFDFTPAEARSVIRGFSDSLEGRGLKLDAKTYGMKLNDLLAKKQEAAVQKQKDADKPFLAKMAREKGAVALDKGIILIPEKEGTGAYPKATDMVKVDYEGTFPNGKVFDSSIKRGTPAEFPLSGVIPCWTEGVQKIKVGGSAKLVCPSDTAYGDQGAPPTIPGGSTLVFEVRLLDILKENPAAATPKIEVKTVNAAEAKAAEAKLAAEKKDAGKK